MASSRHYHPGSEPNFEDWRGYCRGKARFTSKRLANGWRRVILKRGDVNALAQLVPAALHAYKCLNCRFWHLGTDFYKAQQIAAKLLN